MRFTGEMDEFLGGFIPGHSEGEIADAFEERFGIRLTRSQVKNRKAKLGVRSGTHGGRFEKGHPPANKGRRLAEIVSDPEKLERIRATQFRKGEVPWTSRPLGSERVDREGYTWVKVKDGLQDKANDNWRPKAHIEWERANGPLPEGWMVVFADRDKTNYDPGNLVAVDKATWCTVRRWQPGYCDRESLEACILAARIRQAARRRKG